MPQMAQMGHYGSMPQQQYAYAMGVQGMPGMQGYAYQQPQYYYATAGAGALHASLLDRLEAAQLLAFPK